MKEYIIRETDDFLSLSTLFHESGMGVNIEERMPDRVIKMWRMDNARTGELMAALILWVTSPCAIPCSPRATEESCSLSFSTKRKRSASKKSGPAPRSPNIIFTVAGKEWIGRTLLILPFIAQPATSAAPPVIPS